MVNVSKISPKNDIKIVESETEMPKERYKFPEEIKRIIDELRLI